MTSNDFQISFNLSERRNGDAIRQLRGTYGMMNTTNVRTSGNKEQQSRNAYLPLTLIIERAIVLKRQIHPLHKTA
jgi:hypothetical protein